MSEKEVLNAGASIGPSTSAMGPNTSAIGPTQAPSGPTLNSTWKTEQIPRGKHHNKTETKTTVSLYLSKNLVEKARKQGLNLSRITEQALSSILDYLLNQNETESSKYFLSRGSFQKEKQPFAKPL